MTGEVEHLVGEAPLVVVPGDQLDEVAVQGDAGLGVENGGVGIGAEVGGNDLLVHVLQNALHRALGGGLDGGADLVIGGGLLETDGQVHDGHVGSGDTHRHAGELAVQGRDDLADGLGSAGAGGDDVVVNGTGAAQILLLREAVHDGLGGGGGVHGGHQTLNNTEVVVDDLGDGRQAVGGAGGVGHELHVGGVLVQVDAADEHRGVVLRGAGHHDDLRAGVDVSLRLGLVEVNAGALQNVLHAELAPGDEGGVAVGLVGENLDDLAVDGNGAVLVVADDLAIEAAVYGVVLHAVGDVRSGMAGSVDGDNLDVVRLDRGAEREGADAAETIDTNFDHVFILQFYDGTILCLRIALPECMTILCHSSTIITYTIHKNQVQLLWFLRRSVPNFCRCASVFSSEHCSFCPFLL